MRVVLDTNIYISALHFKSGIPRLLLQEAISQKFQLLISKEILAEIRGVLSVKFLYEDSKLDLLENLLLEICKLTEPRRRIRFVKKDPDDDKIIECAFAGEADLIVSGDKHLLELKKYGKIKIITAKEFWEILHN